MSITKKQRDITDEEVEYMECFYTPRCIIESYFHDFDNVSEYRPDKFGNLRLYQIPMLSAEHMIDFDGMAGSDETLKFNLKKNAGDIYNYCARCIGKTLITEQMNLLVDMICLNGESIAFSSVDATRIKGVLDDRVKDSLEGHPFFKEYPKSIQTTPDYRFKMSPGNKIIAINMNINGKNPGSKFYQRHDPRLYIEEESLETNEVYDNRIGAVSELGCIEKFVAMTNFTKQSPCGQIFYNPKNRKHIIHFPQYVSPHWCRSLKESQILKYGGEHTLPYKMFVKGEIIEDGISAFDMNKVKECYLEKKHIINFEINKDNFKHFRTILSITRPRQCSSLYLCGDVGDGAGGSELILASEFQHKFYYRYNITLRSLGEEQHKDIIDYIIEQVGVDHIGLDCGEAMGRALCWHYEERLPEGAVYRYGGNLKVQLGFTKKKDGSILFENGKPVAHEEFMSEFSVRQLMKILYEQHITIPKDHKLDEQLSSVISTMSKNGTRRMYPCPAKNGDHLFDAFKVFAITAWFVLESDSVKMNFNFGIGANSRLAKKQCNTVKNFLKYPRIKQFSQYLKAGF